MELTKEYFDKALKNLVTKKDFDLKVSKLATNEALSKLATRDELDFKLAQQTKELKKFAEDQTELLARKVSSQVIKDMRSHLDIVVRMAVL